MKIAIFHNLPSGGGKRALYEWTKRLSERHVVDVFSFSTADHGFCDLRPHVHSYQVDEFTPRKLFRSPFGRLNQWQRWRDLAEVSSLGRRIARKINAGGYDILFAHPCLYASIPTFLQYIEIPTVYYLHEPIGGKFIRLIKRPYLNSNKWRDMLNQVDPLIKLYTDRLQTLQQKNLLKTDLLLANSCFTQEQIKNEFGQNAAICHLGVDSDTFQPLPGNERGKQVISVGELTPRKGFDFVVESLAQIPSQERPKLVLACNKIDPDEKRYIQNLCAHYGVSLQVLENLSARDLVFEYNRAQLCVYAPILEPFGLVPLESMSSGTPVVGVREGGVEESILHKRTGLLVERNPKKFAQAIQSLLANQDVASEYGRNGREHVLENWTWENSVINLENHLLACANLN